MYYKVNTIASINFFSFFIWRHDIIEYQQVRKYQEEQIDTSKKHMYLGCVFLVFNFLFKLVLMSNEHVDI